MKIKRILISALLAASLVFTAGCGGSTEKNRETIEVALEAGDTIAEFNIEGYGTIKAKLYPDIAPTGVDNFVKLAESGYYDGLTIHRVVKDFMFQGGSLNGDGTGGEAADGGTFGIEIDKEDSRHYYGALCYANAAGRNSTQFYIVNNNEPQDITEFDLDIINSNIDTCKMYKAMYEAGSDGYLYYESQEIYYTNLADMLKNATDEVKANYERVGGTPTLDGGYTVFGQVYEGFDVIDKISASEVKENAGGELSQPVKTITITSVTISEYSAE
ncbi:MAG: peptidylprolyl isomerase [Oscillospiraceae bacterium]|nr:peptidylprolyl isomerase [Oscillospiraceae bacterium]